MKTKEEIRQEIEKKLNNLAEEIFLDGYAKGLNFKKVIEKKYKPCPRYILSYYNKDQPNMENHL